MTDSAILTPAALVALLDDSGYGGVPLPPGVIAKARASDLVVVTNQNDHLLTFEGALYAEIASKKGATKGAFLRVDRQGLVANEPPRSRDVAETLAWARRYEAAATVESVHADPGCDFVWSYRTRLPHATFHVYDRGHRFCQGIVFRRADLPEPASALAR